MDEFIHITYGNPPPKRTADDIEAVLIAQDDLMGGIIDIEEVSEYSWELKDSPIPYSTNDLAVSIAVHFFRQEENIVFLEDAQLTARIKIFEWLSNGMINIHIAKSFEDILYRLYKPNEVEISREKLLARLTPIVNEAESLIVKEFQLSNRNWIDDLINRQGLISFAAGVTKAIGTKYELNVHETGMAVKQIIEKIFKMNATRFGVFVEPSGKLKIPPKWNSIFEEGFNAASIFNPKFSSSDLPFFGKLSICLESVNPLVVDPNNLEKAFSDSATNSNSVQNNELNNSTAFGIEKTIEERLRSILILKENGLITDLVYEQKQRDILKDL